MLWQFLFQRGKGKIDLENGMLCFAGNIDGVKSNTRGYLKCKDGQMVFEYKRLFAISKEVPLFLSELYVIEGLQYPILNTKSNGWGETVLVFSPMYQNQEQNLAEELSAHYGTGLLLSGIRGALRFVRKHFLNKDPEVTAAASS